MVVYCSVSSQGNKEDSGDVWEPPSDSCPLREADSRRVVRLTVKVRYICINNRSFYLFLNDKLDLFADIFVILYN